VRIKDKVTRNKVDIVRDKSCLPFHLFYSEAEIFILKVNKWQEMQDFCSFVHTCIGQLTVQYKSTVAERAQSATTGAKKQKQTK